MGEGEKNGVINIITSPHLPQPYTTSIITPNDSACHTCVCVPVGALTLLVLNLHHLNIYIYTCLYTYIHTHHILQKYQFSPPGFSLNSHHTHVHRHMYILVLGESAHLPCSRTVSVCLSVALSDRLYLGIAKIIFLKSQVIGKKNAAGHPSSPPIPSLTLSKGGVRWEAGIGEVRPVTPFFSTSPKGGGGKEW